MRTFQLKLNRTVDYVTASGRRRPAQVSGGIAGQTCNLRLADGTTRTAIAESTTVAPRATNVWRRP